MKRRIILTVVVVICALSFSALPAQATLITIEIEAEVDSVYDPSGYLEGNISAGDTITGTYTYESTTADTNPSPYVGDYEHFASPAGIFLSVGEFDFTTDLANVDFLVEIINDSTSGGLHDSYGLIRFISVSVSRRLFWTWIVRTALHMGNRKARLITVTSDTLVITRCLSLISSAM